MIIEANKITKKYGKEESEIVALDEVSFTIDEGELVVILGASGAGKSTLLNILGGMDRPTSGEFIVNSKKVHLLNDKELSLFRRYEIGFIFQFYNLINNLTAYENVMLAQSVTKNGLDSEEILEKVGLGKRMKNFPSELSGGEQQRVAIARAIVKNPTVLLCDEPTGALDSKTGIGVIQLLQDICRKEKRTVIIVTHNSLIADIADHLIKISDGKIVFDEYNKNPKKVSEIEW